MAGENVVKILSLSQYSCDNMFSGLLSCYPYQNNPEGNTLAATEFVRLLEVSESVTAKKSNGKNENTPFLGSNSSIGLNPITTGIKQNVTNTDSGIQRPTTGGVTREQFTKNLYLC